MVLAAAKAQRWTDWQELVSSIGEFQVPRDGRGWMGKRWGKRRCPSLMVQGLNEEKEGPRTDLQACAHRYI